MPLATVRLRIIRAATDADAIYWSWAVDGATYDDIDGVALVNSTLTGLENGVGISGDGTFPNMDADLIELFPGAGGPAYYVQGLAPGVPVGTAATSNHVLQCAVNELVDTPRGPAVAGRMFVGPLAATTGTVVTNPQKDFCAGVMQEMAAQHIADGYTPVTISRFLNGAERPAPVGLPIVGWRADNRYDILKSRRIDPVPDGSTDYPLEPVV